MSIATEAKRVNVGQSLVQYKNQIDSAVAQLNQAKLQLTKLKEDMEEDNDYTADDTDEVDTLIASVDAVLK